MGIRERASETGWGSISRWACRPPILFEMKKGLRAIVLLAWVTMAQLSDAYDSVVVFNEIHYHPPGSGGPSLEFVEVYNQNSVNVDLSGWRLSGGVDFTFADGTVIAGDGYLVVAADPAALSAATGAAGVLGPLVGALDNSGETLRLRNNNDRVMDEVDYDDRAPWPIGADGSGASLAKIDPLTSGGRAAGWRHSLEVGGTPGAENFPVGGASGGDNVALGKVVIDGSSAYNGQPFDSGVFSALNVTDGSQSDAAGAYWLGTHGVPGQYFTLDLGAAYAIEEVRIRNTHNSFSNDRGTLSFRLLAAASVDGSNQLVSPQQILSGTLNLVTGQDPIPAEVFTAANGLSETTARYLKFESITALNDNAGLNEIEVYAGGGDASAVAVDLPLRINELGDSAAAPGGFFVEIFNSGGEALDLEGYAIASEAGAEHLLPAGTSAPAGGAVAITEAALGFRLADGDNLYFYLPGKVGLLDAVRAGGAGQARYPDGGGGWYLVAGGGGTPGSPNPAPPVSEVVINEIMYHHRPTYPEEGDPPLVSSILLLDWGASWRFNETGDDLGASWASVAHPVGGGWGSGAGPFGYETSSGNPPVAIATPLTRPALNSPRVVTYYFETDFSVAAADLPNITGLTVTHQIDDGAVFYINGQEVGRYDMPGGAVDATTLASNDTSGEADALRELAVDPRWLVAGGNRISVEVHQASAFSSDVVMGVRLQARTEMPSANPPVAYAPDDEEWVELHNRGGEPADVGGWELGNAVRFTIPAETVIPTGGYLVVARDLVAFSAKFPGVPAVGGFSGKLGNGGEDLWLLDASGNLADEVSYRDGSPWPETADGGGSSMELRNPWIDNASPDAWRASDNSAASGWRDYEFTLTAAAPTYAPRTFNFHELRLGLFGAGVVLLDDVSVVEDPGGAAIELIANGGFADAGGWRLLGTHAGSGVVSDGGENVLRVVAEARMNYLNNLIESNLTDGGALRAVRPGVEYRVSFRAKWLSGSPQFRFELYYNKLARTVVLEQPAAHGTPGAQNSTYEADTGPTYLGLVHSPAVPAPGEAFEVSVAADDPSGIRSMTLHYSVDGGGFVSGAMALSPSDGRWRGTVPGQAEGALVHFYVEGEDDGAGGMRSFAPPGGSDSRAVVEVAAPVAVGSKRTLRINMLAAETGPMHAFDDMLSNGRYRCTIITDGDRIAYDCGIRLRGSMSGRRDPATTGLSLKFPADRPYRGVHRTITTRDKGMGEILVKHIINHAGGIHDNYNDILHQFGHIPSQDGLVRTEMARFTRNYFEGLPGGDGAEGTVFKMEGIREFQATQDGTPDTPKLPFPIGWIVAFDLADQGDEKEAYRHNMRINSNFEKDDYSGIIRMCKLFSLSGGELEDAAPGAIDVDRWTRKFAALSLCGVTDAYSQGNPHNCNFYARPGDGIVEPVPWDWELFFARGTNAPLWGNRNVGKLFARPVYSRLFYGHLHDIINTTFNTAYLGEWFAHYGACAGANYSGFLPYVAGRASFVRSQLPAQVAFSITTNGGSPISTGEPSVVLEGDGWIDVREVYVDGAPDPVPLRWTDGDSWRIEVPVAPGANVISLRAIDHGGAEVGTDSITVTNTGNIEPASAANLVVSELHYHPPGDLPAEFVELQNIHPTASVDLTGAAFVEGVRFTFPPGSVLAPGERLLVVQDRVAFDARYGGGLGVAGAFEGGTRLANGGERIRLVGAAGVTIRDFVYGDRHPWPESPDGDGASLVLIAPGSNPDHSLPGSWRPSASGGGNPGASDATSFPGGDLIGYALAGGAPSIAIDPAGHHLFSYPRRLTADDVIDLVEVSSDLGSWVDAAGLFAPEPLRDLGDGTALASFRSTAPLGERVFVRVRVTLR